MSAGERGSARGFRSGETRPAPPDAACPACEGDPRGILVHNLDGSWWYPCRRYRRLDGLTAAEGRVMDHLVQAVHAYQDLPLGHPAEPGEFVDAIHRAQHLLAARAMARMFPEGWTGARQEEVG